MGFTFWRAAAWCLAAAVAAPAADASPKWQMRYFYDQEKSYFEFVDLQFPSAQRGLAVGEIVEGNHERPAEVVTSDGGAHWQVQHLEEAPVSLFFLNEGLGWMVTSKGLWQTTEAGKTWRKVGRLPEEIFRVYFTDEKTGFAAGIKKKVFQTSDGGQHWEPVPAAAELPGDPEHSAYTWIAFVNPQFGIVTGWNMPPQREARLPDWVDPEAATKRRDFPHLSYSLGTDNGGKTWTTNSASTFGEITRVRLQPNGTGLSLLEFSNAFRYPAEVYKINLKTGKSESVYRDPQLAISDIWLTPDGTAYLGGAQALGKIRNVVPGKIMVLKSQGPDLGAWTEMPVDYRAVANRVFFSAAGADHLWMATDQGMILELQ